MKLKELNLIAFGKFNRKRMELEDGINIIYGENEAGKTTIHSFISGMFYGFLRPYVSRTYYLDEHSRYEPWSGSRYSGIIKFKYRDNLYRIEREFTKDSENTSVFIEDTGQDITANIASGNVGRVLQPGFHFFGFNDVVFSNTISISQLGSKTKDDLANEVRDKLINVSQSLDEDLSIEKAIEQLDASLREIGRERAPTSIYGRTIKKLEDLNEERERIVDYKSDYHETLEAIAGLDKKLTEEKELLLEMEVRLEDLTIVEKDMIYRQAKELREEIKNLELEEKKYRKYKAYSRESYSSAITIKSRLENLVEKREGLVNQLDDIGKNLKKLEDMSLDKDPRPDLKLDHMAYEKLEEEKSQLYYLNNTSKLAFLERDYKDKEVKIKKNQTTLIISLVSTLVMGGLGLASLNPILIILALISTLSLVLTFPRGKRMRKGLEGIGREVLELKQASGKIEGRIVEIEESQALILEKYGLGSRIDLKELYDENAFNISRAGEIEESLANARERETVILDEIGNLDREIKESKDQLKEILAENNSKDLADIKTGLDKKDIYRSIVEEIGNKELETQKVLKGNSIEGLEKYIGQYPRRIEKGGGQLKKDELLDKIERKHRLVAELEREERGLEERLDVLNEVVSKLVEIDEEIVREKKKIRELDEKRQAIYLAKETIEDLSRAIHRQFAPGINKKVGRIIDKITGGKYRDIRIDDNLNIWVVNPESGENIDLNSLSGGTIDQLYFALRFGIIDSIDQNRPPLILDDCFIQYDNKRLSNMMDYLDRIGRERQIILFTCQKREMEKLAKMGKNFNLIEL